MANQRKLDDNRTNQSGADDVDKSSEECDGLRDEVGAAVGPRALELVRDPAVGGPDEPIVGERGPSAVAGETFESLAIVIDDHDTCVQGSRRTGDGPRAEAVGAAHDVGGGGGGGTPGGGGLGLDLRVQVGAWIGGAGGGVVAGLRIRSLAEPVFRRGIENGRIELSHGFSVEPAQSADSKLDSIPLTLQPDSRARMPSRAAHRSDVRRLARPLALARRPSNAPLARGGLQTTCGFAAPRAAAHARGRALLAMRTRGCRQGRFGPELPLRIANRRFDTAHRLTPEPPARPSAIYSQELAMATERFEGAHWAHSGNRRSHPPREQGR